MHKIYPYSLLVVFFFALFAAGNVSAQNLGFEATPATSPPANWSLVTGIWTVNTNPTYVRTGTQSMMITDPATTGTTIGTTNPVITTTSPGYLITMGWGKSDTASNALFYTGYRTGTTNTFNPSSTASGQAANLNDITWSRIISVSVSATLAAGSYGIPIRAFRSASIAGTELYFDDFIIYGSASSVPDVSAPDPASGASIASNNLSWTNGLDNGAPASGTDGVVIVRADGASLPAPTLNDQAMYATTNGSAGTSTFVSGTNTWTVIANISGSTTTSFLDGTAGAGPYTYVIFMRDMAYNYSAGTAVTAASPCVDPPTPGVFNVSPSIAVCPGAPATLSLFGGTGGIGQTFRWESSTTSGGTYTPISGLLSSSFFVINPTSTMFYRAEIICNGGIPVYSTPGQVVVNTSFSGTFSINSNLATGGTNYQTFAEAMAAMTSCGITGPVVFNVDASSGPYTEQVTIPAITGSSATNTVTINGNGRTLQFSPTTGTRHILKLDGADFVTIDGLNILGLATDFGWGIHLINAANNNTIRNCTIDLMAITNITQSNSAGIVASASTTVVTTTGTNASNLIIMGCILKGAYQGIILNGIATGLSVNNIISNNVITDTHGNGIELTHNDGTQVVRNNISRPTRTTMLSGASGIEIGTGNRM